MNQSNDVIALNTGKLDCQLFCIPTASGYATTYMEMALHLDPYVRVIAFEAVGFRGDTEALTTVEEMAEQYADRICEVQTEGPYNILGYSSGGIVAYEVGRVLARRKRSVKMLALVDTVLFSERLRPISIESYMHRSFWIMLITILFNKKFEWVLGKSLTEIWAQPETFTQDHPFWSLSDSGRLQLLCTSLLDHSDSPVWRHAGAERVAKYAAFLKRQWRAIRELYNPQKYNGKMFLFAAAESYDTLSRKLWTELADACTIISVPGSHLTMMGGTNVAALSSELCKILDPAGSGSKEECLAIHAAGGGTPTE